MCAHAGRVSVSRRTVALRSAQSAPSMLILGLLAAGITAETNYLLYALLIIVVALSRHRAAANLVYSRRVDNLGSSRIARQFNARRLA